MRNVRKEVSVTVYRKRLSLALTVLENVSEHSVILLGRISNERINRKPLVARYFRVRNHANIEAHLHIMIDIMAITSLPFLLYEVLIFERRCVGIRNMGKICFPHRDIVMVLIAKRCLLAGVVFEEDDKNVVDKTDPFNGHHSGNKERTV